MERKRIAVSVFALLMTVATTSFAGTITTSKSGYFSCAMAGNGPHCWGNNNAGALGTGSTTPAQSAVPLPVAFSNPAGVTSISAGDTFACAIQNGVVKCWGQNGHGQIGNGSPLTATSPATVLNIQPADAPRNLTAGYFHTCVVKGSTGALYCWGSGLQGELGTGGTASGNVPVPVASMQSDVSAVSAGYAHTCAVKSGQAWCWGKNNMGQLGIGTTSPFEVLPKAVAQGNMTVASLAMGTYHSCLTSTAGALYCFGQNAYGALAHPTLPLSTTPIPIALGLANVGDITANQYTTCAWTESLLEEGDRVQAYCWGLGHVGQLGNGSFQSTHVPQRVSSLGGAGQGPGGGETQ